LLHISWYFENRAVAPQAAPVIEGECDDDAEAAEAEKRRAKRLRADRKQGRR
jgi:hypothetical protein